MARIQIPAHYERGLIKLRRLGEKSLQELLTALADTPPMFEARALSGELAPRISSIPEADLDEIVETLISLYRAQAYLDLSTSELAEYVCEAMSQSENQDLKLDGEECDIFQERLTKLFAIESLTYPAKVSEVVSDHDRFFVRARVLTDVRGIFGPDPEDLPKGAAIVHVLNIAYQQGRRGEKFYVAMDSQDIESLISALQRALAKEKGLKKLLDAAKVRYVRPE